MKKYLSMCKDYDYFEMGLELAIQDGLKVTPVDISDFMCMEVDYIDDLNLVNKILGNNSNEIG